MKQLYFFIFVFIAFMLQVTCLNSVAVFGVKPDLILMLVVWAALELEFGWAWGLSLFAAFLKDIFSVYSFGVDIILFSLYSLAIRELGRKISFDNFYVRLSLLVIVVILNGIFRFVLFSLAQTPIPAGIYLRVSLLETLYTAAVFSLFLKAANPVFGFSK